MKPIYLDYNATTPILPEVAEAMQPFLTEFFGNPSSTHWYGRQTKKAMEDARRQVAALLNCHADEIIFTSGGSESNNYAIKGAAYAYRGKGNHIITSAIEHPAVIEVCRYLENDGFRITFLPVTSYGMVEPARLEEAITPDTILISIMHANNEVGTIQPVADLARIAHDHHILFHSDGAQSTGKIPTDVRELGVDLFSVAGHKLYAPKGIGALFIRRGVNLQKQIHGANHERNLRAGTENVLEIVGLGKASELAAADLKKNMLHMQYMRDRLWEGLQTALGGEGVMRRNGTENECLPNTLSVSFANLEANTILAEIEERLAASAGAACHADEIDVSQTLTAMNVPLHYAMGTLRFSTGLPTTREDIDTAVRIISSTVKRLQPVSETAPEFADDGDHRLTRFTHGLGCACKLRPQALEKILAGLTGSSDPNVIVGTGTSDDAAVYRLDDETAIVQTVDFFTPVVDDPYDFGSIAAANALSDIYAMGATALFALNIVGFPSNRLPLHILEQILKGAQDKAAEAGIAIIGGHTIDDSEPKYGLSVCGKVHPGRVITNAGAKAGDILVLTKPVGTGILTTALKRGLLEEEHKKNLIAAMAGLNKKAAEIMLQYDIHACTDVTGFGLLGHLKEMSAGSGLDAEIDARKVPVLEPALELAGAGMVPGGTENNLAYLEQWIRWPDNISHVRKIVLCDAQTSGGLLISLSESQADAMIKVMHQNGINDAVAVGRFTKQGKGIIGVSA
jgi:cysteine desulfurase